MQLFFALIDRLNAAEPAARGEIERFVWDSFQRDVAVLALDMSSFSMSVRRDGLLTHLCQIRRMHRLTAPLVASAGGEVVKYEADNLLAIFDDAAGALKAAMAINRAISASDAGATAPPLAVSIGIDCGPVLHLPGEDCFGDAVNVAFKLGEDVAKPGEILLTERVRDRLDNPSAYALDPVRLSIAGLEIQALRLAY